MLDNTYPVDFTTTMPYGSIKNDFRAEFNAALVEASERYPYDSAAQMLYACNRFQESIVSTDQNVIDTALARWANFKYNAACAVSIYVIDNYTQEQASLFYAYVDGRNGVSTYLAFGDGRIAGWFHFDDLAYMKDAEERARCEAITRAKIEEHNKKMAQLRAEEALREETKVKVAAELKLRQEAKAKRIAENEAKARVLKAEADERAKVRAEQRAVEREEAIAKEMARREAKRKTKADAKAMTIAKQKAKENKLELLQTDNEISENPENVLDLTPSTTLDTTEIIETNTEQAEDPVQVEVQEVQEQEQEVDIYQAKLETAVAILIVIIAIFIALLVRKLGFKSVVIPVLIGIICIIVLFSIERAIYNKKKLQEENEQKAIIEKEEKAKAKADAKKARKHKGNKPKPLRR